MTHELFDALGLLAVLLQLSGVAGVSVRAYMLRRRQTGKCGFHLGYSGVLTLIGLLWCAVNLADTTSIISAVGNGLQDIPPITTLRVALLGVWLWVLQGVLYRLAEETL